MSTRCMVKIIDRNSKTKEITLYHHHDGYPSGVGCDLMRRSETWLRRAWNWDIDEIANELVKDNNDEYEITCFEHTDSEYYYIIDCQKKNIECQTYRTKEKMEIPYNKPEALK